MRMLSVSLCLLRSLDKHAAGLGELIEHVLALALGAPSGMSFRLARDIVDPADEVPGVFTRPDRLIAAIDVHGAGLAHYVDVIDGEAPLVGNATQRQPATARHGDALVDHATLAACR